MPNAPAMSLAPPIPAITPTAVIADAMSGFASIVGPQSDTPRYVNTPSRHCITRKMTTTRSPNMLLGSSQRLYKVAIRFPPMGAGAAHRPPGASPRGVSHQKQCLEPLRCRGLGAGGLLTTIPSYGAASPQHRAPNRARYPRSRVRKNTGHAPRAPPVRAG